MNNLINLQIWFIKCAIDVKDSVLPFEAINDDIFEEDYGVTKKIMLEEIKNLRTKLL